MYVYVPKYYSTLNFKLSEILYYLVENNKTLIIKATVFTNIIFTRTKYSGKLS